MGGHAQFVDFYPRSPCGERHVCRDFGASRPKFLSTLSLRRATQVFQRIAKPFRISIHALLAESDWDLMGGLSCNAYFYPRSPCGERPAKSKKNKEVKNFYPRSPCGERPRTGLTCGDGRNISIHALLAESDKSSVK